MIPIDVNEQLAAVAAPPQGVRGQHSSPSSGAARASAGEALVWHFVCDEICEVLCEVLSNDADDVDDAARGPGALTASAASTLKRRREEDAAAPANADPPPCELPLVASAASPWVAACADLLEAAKDRKNMIGLRTPLRSRGFRCGPPLSTSPNNFGVTVPPDFPCYYDLVGKNYASGDYANSLPTLRKYLDGALALARTGGAYRTEAEYDPRAAVSVRAKNGRAKTSRFTGVHGRPGRWIATISVRGSPKELGRFDVEEDAARAWDAAVVKYELSGRTLNFPGEAPRADVLDALPPPLEPIVAPLEVARARCPPRALPRGTTYPDGGMSHKVPTIPPVAAGYEPKMKKSASKKKKKKTTTTEPAKDAKDGGEPKMKKLSGYNYHNAQNYELAKAMVESEPATAQLVACEKNQAVIKKLGAMWGELDDAARQAYVDDAAMVVKDGGEPKMKKQGGYQYHNAQNCKLARAMVESDPATAKLGAQEKIGAVNRKLGAMWSALDDAAKQAYADIAPMVAVKPRKAKKSKVVEAAAFGVRAKSPPAPELAPASKKEPAHVCACCGGTTLTAAGEPMRTRVLFCENDACRAEYHLPCVGLDAVPAGAWRCPACVPRAATAEAAPLSAPVLPTEGSPPAPEPAPARQDGPPPPRPKVYAPPTAGFSSSDSEPDDDSVDAVVAAAPAAPPLADDWLELLQKWTLAHAAHPYPNKAEWATLVRQTGKTPEQVYRWFATMRFSTWSKLRDGEREPKGAFEQELNRLMNEAARVAEAAAAEARALAAADLAAIREAYARERPVAAVLGELGREMVSSVHVAAHTRASWDASALYAFQAALRRQPGPVCHSFKDLLKSMRSGAVSEIQGRRSITRLLSGDLRLLERFQHVVRSTAAPVGDAVATVAWYDPENPTEELYAYATPAAAAAEFGLAEKAVFDCLEGRAKDADGVCFRWQTDWPLPVHAVATRRRGVYRLGTEGRFRAQLGERDGFLGNFDSEGAAALVCEAGRAAASRPPAREVPRVERGTKSRWHDAAIPVIPPPEPASWAQCARCDKWRVLASGTNLADLPEKWTCRDDGLKTCESVECSLTECATCECHTSNCEVVLVSPAGDVEMRYCSPRGAAACHRLSRKTVHNACLKPDPDRRQNVFRYAHDLTWELRRRRRVGAGLLDSEPGDRIFAHFDTDLWWGGTVLSRSGPVAETRYHVVFDDGESRSVWAADVSNAPPPGATVGADGPNARARAIVAESQGKSPSKRPRADAASPRRLPSKRARPSTSGPVGRACEVRKVGESIWRRFASVKAAGEGLALYFPDLGSSTVTNYLKYLLANRFGRGACPIHFREAFEARYVDAPDATAPPVPDQAAQSAAPAPASIVVSRPPSPLAEAPAPAPMTDIEEALAPSPCEWPVPEAIGAAPAVSTPDRATVSPPRESPTRAESELLPVGELVLADKSGTGDDWAEGSVATVHADGFYDIQYRTVRTPQRRVPAHRVRPYGRRRRGASEPMDVDPPPTGSRVAVRFSNGTYYAGTVDSVRGDKAVIQYDDGDRETITFPAGTDVRVTRVGPEPEPAAVSCPICLDTMAAATTFRFACSHVICGECCSTLAKVAMESSIAQRSGIKVACPICRRPERLALPEGVL